VGIVALVRRKLNGYDIDWMNVAVVLNPESRIAPKMGSLGQANYVLEQYQREACGWILGSPDLHQRASVNVCIARVRHALNRTSVSSTTTHCTFSKLGFVNPVVPCCPPLLPLYLRAYRIAAAGMQGR
jgi:hypothetical protein